MQFTVDLKDMWIYDLLMKTNTVTFEMNGNGYETDAETLNVLRSIVPSAKATSDFSAVIAVMDLGEATGRIRMISGAAIAGIPA